MSFKELKTEKVLTAGGFCAFLIVLNFVKAVYNLCTEKETFGTFGAVEVFTELLV